MCDIKILMQHTVNIPLQDVNRSPVKQHFPFLEGVYLQFSGRAANFQLLPLNFNLLLLNTQDSAFTHI